jgi:CheY-like chemotaxis protein
MSNNFFTIASLFYSIMLVIIYFNKDKVNTSVTKIYSYMIISNFLTVVTAIICYGTISINEKIPAINNFVSKTLLLLYITWSILFTVYIYVITRKDDKSIKSIKKSTKYVYLIISYIIFALIIYYLPLYYHNENKIIYSYGPSANFVYVITAILMLYWIFLVFKNYQILKSKKCIPIVLFIVFCIIVVIIQKLHPGLLLITFLETFITVIMYFTIENPDVKLLTEVYKSKEISDSANDEKNLFIYNMTQEIREITKKVNNEIDYILNSDSITDNKEAARKIKEYTNNFKIVTNDILDVDITNDIKIYNNKYNIKNLFKEIINIYSNKIENKGLSFNINIEHSLPEFLYGDKINFKELLNNVLDYALSETLHGYIELNVNTIIKNDVCRLMISVEDSSTNNNINTITKDNKELYKSYKLAILLNGTMSVLSNPNKNTFKIILDQKIYEEDNIVNKYSNVFNNKKILIVDNVDTTYKIIEKLLKDTNIQLDLSLTSKDCLNKIRSKEHYDLIFLEENMNIISSTELIKKLRNERNFNTPIILLTKNNDVEYNNEYKKIGYNYYLLKPIKKENLNDILDEYIK